MLAGADELSATLTAFGRLELKAGVGMV